MAWRHCSKNQKCMASRSSCHTHTISPVKMSTFYCSKLKMNRTFIDSSTAYVGHPESFEIEEILSTLVASSLRRKSRKVLPLQRFPFATFVDFLIDYEHILCYDDESYARWNSSYDFESLQKIFADSWPFTTIAMLNSIEQGVKSFHKNIENCPVSWSVFIHIFHTNKYKTLFRLDRQTTSSILHDYLDLRKMTCRWM